MGTGFLESKYQPEIIEFTFKFVFLLKKKDEKTNLVDRLLGLQPYLKQADEAETLPLVIYRLHTHLSESFYE